MSSFQRRDFLTRATAFAAGATAMLVRTRQAGADDKPPQPVRGQKGASIIGLDERCSRGPERRQARAPADGPRRPMPNLRFSFADVHNPGCSQAAGLGR